MQINFTGSIKIQGSALIKLASLNNAAMSGEAQNAYDKLKTTVGALAEDLLIETSGKDGVKISKLIPFQRDTVEITNNSDFIKGLEEAAQIIEKEGTPLPLSSYLTEQCRLRIIEQIKKLN